MRPLRPQQDNSLAAAALALGLLAWVVLLASRRVYHQEEELRIEHNRRLELEDKLETRERQLDGALDKIHELRPDAPAAASE